MTNLPPLPRLHTSTAIPILLLLVLAMVGLAVASGIMAICFHGSDSLSDGPALYFTLVAQDVLAFIVPAIAAMAICFHQPLSVMGLNRTPSWSGILVALLVWVVSLPMMNWVVEWNKSIHLPDSLRAIEDLMRMAEDMAEAATEQLLSGTSIGKLLANVMVVGVMAGVSEEIFFRGGMQRLLTIGRWNTHAAVWVVAIVFSAVHFQFFGFVPRMLLGAWLGYLLVRTGSLWVPIFAHALNNSLVVVASWLGDTGHIATGSLDNLGIPQSGEFPWLALGSAVVTIALIVWYMKSKNHEEHAL